MMRSGLAMVLVTLASAVAGCGETANTIGQVSTEGGASAGGSTAGGSAANAGMTVGGSASGGSATAGTASGGTASGGTANGGTASGGTANGGAGGSGGLACEEAKPLDGNWEMCGSTILHRSTPGKCTHTPSNAVLRPTGNDDQCLKDTDCTAQPFGMCRISTGAFGSINYCDYGCEVDADCDAGSICVCADTSISSFGSWGESRSGSCQRIADCMSDQDCQGGNWCAPYDSNPGCYSPVFACTTDADECQVPADCPDFPHASCTFDGTHRVCRAAGCVVD